MTLEAQGLSLTGRLQGISASLKPGEVTAICGPNGAGKSSLLAALAGLLPADRGMVRLGGTALEALPVSARAQQIGYLPQSPVVAWDVSVEVLVGLGRLPWPGAPDGGAIEAALLAMDLLDLRHRAVSQLSGGERARALMARVLATGADWLLADEPLANLDLAHALSLAARFREQAARGAGVVLVLHDLAMAMNHADRVLVLNHGSLVADGPPQVALGEAVIAQVWGVQARWLGDKGHLALALS